MELVLSVAVSLWRFNGLLTGFLSVACAAAAPATRSYVSCLQVAPQPTRSGLAGRCIFTNLIIQKHLNS